MGAFRDRDVWINRQANGLFVGFLLGCIVATCGTPARAHDDVVIDPCRIRSFTTQRQVVKEALVDQRRPTTSREFVAANATRVTLEIRAACRSPRWAGRRDQITEHVVRREWRRWLRKKEK